ncbi:hypothetical protein [Methylocella sp.]|uniref:hypothetical protein n=1 Tax=Methylocella sp. TaxID=1978226 RepID=UPI00378325C8
MSGFACRTAGSGLFSILGVLAGLGLVADALTPAAAQSTRKECSEKYQAAKAAGSLGGLTWPQFYSQCAAQARGEAPAAPAAAPSSTAAPASPAAPAPAPTVAKAPPAAPVAPAAPAAAGAAVFPSAVSATYANEKPGRARMKTCLDQYKANKATNANGGLRWIQAGGGYYSQCNAKLKG